MQTSTSIAIPSIKGATNLKVSSVNEFSIGQKVVVGNGADSEIATIALIGTACGSTISTATKKVKQLYLLQVLKALVLVRQ